MTATTDIFITGVNRGLGRALAEAYLIRPNYTVVGSVRDLASAGTKELQDAPRADGTKLLLVKIESESLTDPAEAVKQIQAEGVTKLDVVIASAGITGKLAPLIKTDLADFEHALKVNTIAPAALFQATKPLLDEAKKPKWVSLSTISASLGTLEQNAAFPTLSYGASKAAFNFITRSIHVENENIIAVAVHPGFVKTDMGNGSARFFGLPEAFHEVDDSIKAVLKIVDGATREETSGKFYSFDESIVPW